MQSAAPEAVDLAASRNATKALYGLDDHRTVEFGTRCLLARRLVERGVRFVQLYSGGGPVAMQWDAHDDIDANHEKMCGMTDKPVAALLDRPEALRACSTRRSSSGGASSAEPRCVRVAVEAATTTPPGSPCGWPAAA